MFDRDRDLVSYLLFVLFVAAMCLVYAIYNLNKLMEDIYNAAS